MFNRLTSYISIIWESCIVELKLFFKDNAVYVSFLGTSIIISLLYSAIYGNEVIEKLPVVIVDNDNSSASRELVRMLDATQGVYIYANASSLQDAKVEFSNGEAKGILYIPEQFSHDLQKGKQATVSAYLDASYMLYYKTCMNAISKTLGYFDAQLEVATMAKSGTDPRYGVLQRRLVNPVSIPLFNPYSGYATFILPLVYLIIIQTTLMTAIGIMGGTHREFNTFYKHYNRDGFRFAALPILLGRAMSYLLLCLFVLLIMLGFWFTIFKLPQRSNLLDIIVFMIPFFLSVTFMGIALTGIFRKREDAVFVISFASLPAVFLSGISWPTVAFPSFIRCLSYIFPTTIGSKGFIGLTQLGAAFSEMKDYWQQMWLTCLIYFLIALAVEIWLLTQSNTKMAASAHG